MPGHTVLDILLNPLLIFGWGPIPRLGIAGSAAALGKIIPGAEVLDIPNRDHMRAVGDKVYKTGVTDFLSRRQ